MSRPKILLQKNRLGSLFQYWEYQESLERILTGYDSYRMNKRSTSTLDEFNLLFARILKMTSVTQSFLHIEDFESSKFSSLIGEDTIIPQIGPPLERKSVGFFFYKEADKKTPGREFF